MRVFPVRGKEMAFHAKRFFARRRVIHRSCGEQTRRALLASMNNSGGTISLGVALGWPWGGLGVALGWLWVALAPISTFCFPLSTLCELGRAIKQGKRH